MGYAQEAGKGLRQEFTSCYCVATSSYGHGMAWSFPGAVGPAILNDGVDYENLGYYARPAHDRLLIPTAGVMWNHERDALPNEEALIISRGVAPKVHVDARMSTSSGNNYAYTYALAYIPPNWPLGSPNAYGFFATDTFYVQDEAHEELYNTINHPTYGSGTWFTYSPGNMWPQNRGITTEWNAVSVHMVTMDTCTITSTAGGYGTPRVFIGGCY